MTEARKQYEPLLRQLHQLIKEGKDDTDEADSATREPMFDLWCEMTDEERHEMKALSVSLYETDPIPEAK